jgi:Na+:H+ antiporter, NhaA family
MGRGWKRGDYKHILRPFQAFAEHKTAGGILLLLCTVVALVWANSPWADAYTAPWHTQRTIGLAGRVLSHDLHFWVNDRNSFA